MSTDNFSNAYERLGRWLAHTLCDGDNWFCDLDGRSVGEQMLKLGIVKNVTYDPAQHGHIYFNPDPLPGELVQIFEDGAWPLKKENER